MKKFLASIKKTARGVAALAIAFGMLGGTALAGDGLPAVLVQDGAGPRGFTPVFDVITPVPYTHGGSAGFTDLSIFSAANYPFNDEGEFEDAGVTSVLGNGFDVPGLVTQDPRTGLLMQADIEAIPTAGGQITGVITVRTFTEQGDLILAKEIPARGIHRFRENWISNLRNDPSSLDGDLRRVVNHNIIITGRDTGTGVRFIARTDPQSRVLSTRLQVAPWLGKLFTRVSDLRGILDPASVSNAAQFNQRMAVRGVSDSVFLGPLDEPQGWMMDNSDVTVLTPNNRHLLIGAWFFSPYNRDSGGNIVAIRNTATDARIFVHPYRDAQNRPGRYNVFYRGHFGGARSFLRQYGWNVARESEIAAAITFSSVEQLLFGQRSQGGMVFDQFFVNSSPAAFTRIQRGRNVNDLVRPLAPVID